MSKNKLYQDSFILNLFSSAVRTAVFLLIILSLSTSVLAKTQQLTLWQAIEQVNQYQASQDFWQTPNRRIFWGLIRSAVKMVNVGW